MTNLRWVVREACSGNSAQPFENRFSNVFGGNESGFSNEVTAIPAPPALAVPAYVYEWGYDKAGNRVSKDCTSGQAIFGESTYSYDDENRLVYEDTELGRIDYAYDDNGNTVRKTKQWNGEVERYGYDYANRMNSYTNAQSDVWSYVFAPTGERLAKINPPSDGTEEWYAYDGPDVIADYSRAGGNLNWESSYVQGLGIDSKIARITAQPPNGPVTYYYVGDALNSVHKIVDQTQSTINTNVSNAWGEQVVTSESVPERYGFTQREKAPECELQYSRNRMYDQKLGRFTGNDPASALLRYDYCTNNPVRFLDPRGLWQSDFHYYAVYAIAIKAGQNAQDAATIANASEFVDECTPDMAEAIGTFQPIFTYSEADWASAKPSTWENVFATFHFLPGGEGANLWSTKKNSANARGLVKWAIASKDLFQIGIALHTFADTFSHEGFSGIREAWNQDAYYTKQAVVAPAIGHAEFGNDPDLIDNSFSRLHGISDFDNSELGADAAMEIYGLLGGDKAADRGLWDKFDGAFDEKDLNTRIQKLSGIAGGNIPAPTCGQWYGLAVRERERNAGCCVGTVAHAEALGAQMRPGFNKSNWYHFQVAAIAQQRYVREKILPSK